VIAVIDSGVDYAHEDLAANIWDDGMGNPGRDFVDIDLRLGSRRLFGGR
jgi:subtilisin family serine protease